MGKYLKKYSSLFSFIFIPIVYFWDPNWVGFLGIQPYWSLFWLLPWSMINGSINGLVVGLFLGLTLDAISPDSSFTQIPGLILCGVWFGKLSISNNDFVGHFRYGLICSIGSLLCGSLYFFQVLIKNWSYQSNSILLSGIKNIFAQVFVTGLLAPLLCSSLLIFFQKSNKKSTLGNIRNK